jgi:DNA polymerase III sliding clamp (beta) subunit (PCNA family)
MKKFSVATNLLLRELTFLSEALGNGQTNPHWSAVVINAEGDKATAYAFSGLNAAQTSFILKEPIPEPVNIALPGKDLTETVSFITSDTVTFSEGDAKVTVSAGKGKYNFSKLVDATPNVLAAIHMDITGETVTLASKPFVEALRVATVFVAKEDNSKYTMAGVGVKATELAIHGCAMDGFRAIEAVNNDQQAGRNTDLYIPKEGIGLAMGVVDVDPVVAVTRNDNAFLFVSGKRKALVRRAVTENPPKITANIDKFVNNAIAKVEVDTKELVGAVKRLQTACEGKFRLVNFKTTDNGLVLFASEAISGKKDFEEEVVAKVTGSGVADLQGSYVLDFLKYVEGAVTIHIGALPETSEAPRTPTIFTHPSGLRYLVMQMKTK